MAIFGHKHHKRSRSSRVSEIVSASTLLGRIGERLRNRGVLLRLFLCSLATILLVVGVKAWESPFRYRLNDYAPLGIQSRVDFEMIDEEETRRAREEAIALVPYVFQNDTTLLEDLVDELQSDLEEIAKSESLSDLTTETQAAFRFVASAAVTSTSEDADLETQQQFRVLKSAVTPENDGAVSRLDQVIDEFRSFVSPLVRLGRADPADLTTHEIELTHDIEIRSLQDAIPSTIAQASDVLLIEMLKDAGALGRAWESSPSLATIRPQLEEWLLQKTPFTLQYSAEATEQAKERAEALVPPVTDRYLAGDVLVSPGTRIDETSLAVLFAEYEQVERMIGLNERVIRVLTVLLMVIVLSVLIGYYLVHNEPRLIRSINRFSVFLIAVVSAVILGRLLSFDPARAEVIPLTVTVMVFAIAYNQVFATLIAFTLSLILTLSTVVDLGHFVLLMSVSTTAVMPLAQVSSRSKLIKVGFFTGATYFFVACGIEIISRQSINSIWLDREFLFDTLLGSGWCLAAGYLVAGNLPFVESAFGVVTDISLLEMSDVSDPLLQELVRRAPGTYNHSVAVATIGEAAADQIGANGLLVRVGAYFHDIGKMLKPEYFVENLTEGSESRHEHLAPAMSTLIIIGHVKDGVDLAKQHHLPQPIIDFIEQHHGTTLVEYFYHEASRKAGAEPDHQNDAQESSFRYPGPKPQSREAGVMMLADAVESASRTLSDPTPKRIESLVHSITMKRLLDGQFDDSSLTLSEIRTVEESLTKSLIGVYHGRIKYPQQRTA